MAMMQRRRAVALTPKILVLTSSARNPARRSYSTPLPKSRDGNIKVLGIMTELVTTNDDDLALIDWANALVEGISSHEPERIANTIFAYVRSYINPANRQREGIIYRSDPYGYEQIQDARKTIERGYGDCGDKAVLMSALLSALGIKTRFVVLSYKLPAFQHVYLEAYYSDAWHAFDPTPEESIPGWESKGMSRAVWRIFSNDAHTPPGLSGIFSKIGKGLKKVAKVAAPIAAGLIPGVGQYASQGVSMAIDAAGAKGAQKSASKAAGAQFDQFASQATQLFNRIQSQDEITPSDAAEAHAAFDTLEQAASSSPALAAKWASASYRPAYINGLSKIDAGAQAYQQKQSPAQQRAPGGGSLAQPSPQVVSGGLLGGISTTTLLLIGGGALALFAFSQGR